jgi:hypothetical protein
MPRPKTSETRTDAQRRAANKYQYKTATVIGCKLDRETAERYKSHCSESGTTPNAEIKAFILSQLGEQLAE